MIHRGNNIKIEFPLLPEYHSCGINRIPGFYQFHNFPSRNTCAFIHEVDTV